MDGIYQEYSSCSMKIEYTCECVPGYEARIGKRVTNNQITTLAVRYDVSQKAVSDESFLENFIVASIFKAFSDTLEFRI